MIHAYIEYYLSHARTNFGRMLDTGVNVFHYSLGEFYDLFLNSSIAIRFAEGEPCIIAGHSGIELAYEVLEENGLPVNHADGESIYSETAEFWTGWALAYYQHRRCWTFAEINAFASIDDVFALYSPYHEMDIMQFVDAMDNLYNRKYPENRLKSYRVSSGLSQSRLALLSGIPLRTLQQYEQGQKNLRHARADYVLGLARILHCPP